MFTRTEKSLKTARKSGRSTSPRAVERRRFQNRLSQRNHRRRVKETAQDTKRTQQGSNKDVTLENAHQNSRRHASVDADSTHPVEYINSQACSKPPLTAPPVDMTTNYPFTADDLTSQDHLSWPHFDRMATMPIPAGNESYISQPSFTPQGCTCNGIMGPCPGHLEHIRADILAGNTSPLPLHQQHPNHHAPYSYIPMVHQPPETPPNRYSFSKSSTARQPPGAAPGAKSSLSHLASHTKRPSTSAMEAIMPKRLTHSPSNMVLPNGSSSSMRGTTTPSSSLSCATLVDAPLEQSSVEGKLASGDTDANITQRFVIVLEAMQKAGFQDFDVMAVAYYTTQFEKGSLPAMVQCASRSRRLKAMVQELHESTGQWPRWESRGLRESVSEATASLCVEEMERLSKVKVPNPVQSEAAGLIAAFESLLWDHESIIQGDRRSYLSPLEEVALSGEMEATPESVPHLWSLLTELAGTQGLYCDRIARVMLAILLHARSAQR